MCLRSFTHPSLPLSLPPLLPFLRFPTGIARAFSRPADRDHSRDGEQGDGVVEVGREGGREGGTEVWGWASICTPINV